LKLQFEFRLGGMVTARAVFHREVLINLGVEGAIGSVDNSRGIAGLVLLVEEVADVAGNVRVMSGDDFVEEGGADDVDMVCGHDSAGKKVDGVVPVGFVVTMGIVVEVEFVPKVAAGDATIVQLGEGRFLGVDVVDGEEGGDPEFLGFGWNESGHPIITVNNVWLNPGDDVVDEVALEGESRHEEVFLTGFVNSVSTVEFAVLREVDPVSDGDAGAGSGVLPVAGEKFPIVGDGEVDVLVAAAQSVHEKGGDVRESARFGPQSFGIDGESF
jgi:hypothetical protein